MDAFKYNKFFDIENFYHRELFEASEKIWDVIKNLNEYINSKKLSSINSPIPESCFLENKEKIFIGMDCKIEPNTYIRGPAIIENGVKIRHGAYIRGNVIIGKNSVIGHCSEVKNSIFLNSSSAAHFDYVGDSILGNNVNLGAGVKCANFRLDRSKISFFKDGNKISTELLKFGSIIGDNTQIGCNTVLNPATFIQRNVIIYSCINVGGYLKENSIVKPPLSYIVKEKSKSKFYADNKK